MFLFNPVAFTIWGAEVRWYGIMIACGVLAALLLAAAREKRFSLPADTASTVVLIAIPAAIICARLYYVVFSWDVYKDDLLQIFNIRNGGLALYGGLIGGITAGVLYARHANISALKLADLAAPCIAAGQMFGRWGNFFNQEAYGVAVTNPSFQFFPAAVYIQAQSGWFCATFFYESAWCALIVLGILIAEKKKTFLKDGDGILWYAIGYAVERAVVEGLRTDSLYIGSLRISQLVSAAVLLIAGIILLARLGSVKQIPYLLFSAILLILTLFPPTATLIAAEAAAAVLTIVSYLLLYRLLRKKESPCAI